MGYMGPERRLRPRPPTRGPVRRVLGRMWWLIAYSETAPVRFFLAQAAALWAVALMLPGDSFNRPTFAYAQVMAPEGVWCVAFGLYAVAAFWRVFTDAQPGGGMCALAVNTVGLFLFSAMAFCVLSVGRGGVEFPAGSAAHLSIAMAAMWVLVRTHVNSPRGWLND